MRPDRLSALCLAVLLFGLAACAQRLMPPGPGPAVPALEGARLIMDDGMALPLRRWMPPANPGHEPEAVILALHGFNDYGTAFAASAEWWAERRIATYAYDQRGFGAAPHTGLWAGTDRMVEDLRSTARLIRARHPGVPFYILGESMGAAVVIVAAAGDEPPEADGLILSAPAVWARETMPFYQRAALWLAARTIPWARFTGRGLGIRASDNIEMLRALGRDPLVIKETRVSAMDGLTDLMSEALAAAPRFAGRALVLYGENDEVVPGQPVLRFWRNLPESAAARQRRALYANGWHMLLRDLAAEVVRRDVAAWIAAPDQPLPSGADRDPLAKLSQAVNGDG